MSDDYIWDGSGDGESDILALEQTMAALRHDRPMRPLGARFVTAATPTSWARPVLLGALLSSALTVLLIWGFVQLDGTDPEATSPGSHAAAVPVAAPPSKRRVRPPVQARDKSATLTAERVELDRRQLEAIEQSLEQSLALLRAMLAAEDLRRSAERAAARRGARDKSRLRSKAAADAALIDCILDPTTCSPSSSMIKEPREPAGRPSSKPSRDTRGLPERLSSSDIRAGIVAVKHRAKSCGRDHDQPSGEKISIKMTISGASGRVLLARATGQYAGTDVGECVAAVFKRARFPKFAKPTLGVIYPIRF